WIAMALQSARMAGIKVPDDCLEKLNGYLDRVQADGGSRYSYVDNGSPTPGMSAVGLLCRQYMGWKRDDPRLERGCQFVSTHQITYTDSTQQDVYYWYYATQVLHHMEGKLWNDWNAVMREQLPSHQVKTGAEAGSWDPSRDQWGSFGGRLYV